MALEEVQGLEKKILPTIRTVLRESLQRGLDNSSGGKDGESTDFWGLVKEAFKEELFLGPEGQRGGHIKETTMLGLMVCQDGGVGVEKGGAEERISGREIHT